MHLSCSTLFEKSKNTFGQVSELQTTMYLTFFVCKFVRHYSMNPGILMIAVLPGQSFQHMLIWHLGTDRKLEDTKR